MKIIPVKGLALYSRDDYRQRTQRVEVMLDCRNAGCLSAEVIDEINGISAGAQAGHVLTWPIPALHEKPANALLVTLAMSCERVLTGYDTRMNERGNLVAMYTDEAADAISDIARLCELADVEDDKIRAMSAADYYADLGDRAAQARELGISATTTDEERRAIVDHQRREAASNGVDHLYDLPSYVDELRVLMRSEAA